MKKKFLEFLKGRFEDYKELSDEKIVEEFKKKTANEVAETWEAFNEKTIEEIKVASEAKLDEKVTELKAELLSDQIEQMKTINEALKQQGVQIKKLSDAEKAERTEQSGSFAENLHKQLAEHAEVLSGMKDKPTSDWISLKVVGDMTIAGNVSGGNVPVEQRIPGFNTIASRLIRLLDIVSRGTATSNIISWVFQANKEGAAGTTAEGATKNQIDFDLVVDNESVKKLTAFIKVSNEMIGDIDFMESEIRNELMRELLKVVESQVYDGDGTGNNLNGIRTVSTAFAAGTFADTVDNANIVDVLRVAMNQIAIAEQGMPNAILMHPSDITALLLDKVTTTDKRYIMALQEIASSRTLDGVPMIGTTLVAQDDYLVGSFDLATVWDRGDVSIEIGLDGNDFTKNFVTIRAEWRGLVIVKTNDRTAFVEGDFTTDAAALETP